MEAVKEQVSLFYRMLQIGPAFTNLIEISLLGLETVYDNKNDSSVIRSTCRTESCENLNLPCCKATLQAPRMCCSTELFMAEQARNLTGCSISVDWMDSDWIVQ